MTTPRTNNLEDRHPIQVAARYTGLSSDLIRAWEKRYRVVEPARAKNGRRLYSNADIQRLSLLRQVTQFGRRISEVAHLPADKLTEIVKRDEDAVVQRSNHRDTQPSTGSVMELFDQCLDAVTRLDPRGLQTSLNEALKELGTVFLLEDLISPLLHHLAEECRQGELLNCHQRLAIETIHGYLAALCTQNEATQGDFVVCSMKGDPMLTALRVAVIANTHGWTPIHLGEHVTCDEIADAVASSKARAAVISFDGLGEDTRIPNEVRRLVSLLPDGVRLIVNAPDASAYSTVLSKAEVLHIHNSGELRLEFERLAAGESK